MEKHCKARQATDTNMAHALRTLEYYATDIHLGYEILIDVHDNNGYVNAPQCYVYIHNPLLLLILMAETYLDQLVACVRC